MSRTSILSTAAPPQPESIALRRTGHYLNLNGTSTSHESGTDGVYLGMTKLGGMPDKYTFALLWKPISGGSFWFSCLNPQTWVFGNSVGDGNILKVDWVPTSGFYPGLRFYNPGGSAWNYTDHIGEWWWTAISVDVNNRTPDDRPQPFMDGWHWPFGSRILQHSALVKDDGSVGAGITAHGTDDQLRLTSSSTDSYTAVAFAGLWDGVLGTRQLQRRLFGGHLRRGALALYRSDLNRDVGLYNLPVLNYGGTAPYKRGGPILRPSRVQPVVGGVIQVTRAR